MCIQWWGCYQQAMKYSFKFKKYIMKGFWVLLCKWDVPHFETVPDGQLVKRKYICGQVKVEWYNSQEKETPSQGITSCESLFYLSIFFLSSPPESYCCTKLTPSQWEVLTTSPLLDVKIQKMEPGRPAQTGDTHQLELTSSYWTKLAQHTLLDTWPQNKIRKLKCRIMQERVIWVDTSSRSNVHFLHFLKCAAFDRFHFTMTADDYKL